MVVVGNPEIEIVHQLLGHVHLQEQLVQLGADDELGEHCVQKLVQPRHQLY